MSQMRESAEERMVAAAVAGDGVAFGELTERYRRNACLAAHRAWRQVSGQMRWSPSSADALIS